MSRKNTHLHTMKDSISGASELDLSADATSQATNVQFSDNIGIQLVWTGSSPSGEVLIQSSNDYDPIKNTGTWTNLDFGVPILITGNSGNHIININLVPFAWIRLFYDRTSGTGTMTSTLVMKQVGG